MAQVPKRFQRGAIVQSSIQVASRSSSSSTLSSQDSSTRVEALTFFRFIAAVIVVVFHYGQAAGLSAVLTSGPQMVTFFFVLSGFVMGISYYHKKEVVAKTYWWARVSRIMPVYLLALFLTIVFLYLQREKVDIIAAGLDIVLLQSWLTPYPIKLNSPGWSLSAEMFFYFSFPFILKAISQNKVSTSRLFIISIIIWLATQIVLSVALTMGYYTGFPSTSHDLIFYFPPSHFCSFLLGVSGGVWFIRNHTKISAKFSVAVLPISIGLLWFLLTYPYLIERYVGFKLAFSSSFLSPFFLIFIIALSVVKHNSINLLKARPLILLGEASYSIYILQLPIHQFYYRYFDGLRNNYPVVDFYCYLILLITLSICLFVFFEKRANIFLRYSLPDKFKGAKFWPAHLTKFGRK
ncbi:acyltransferase [Sapientia aquatica]|uniref:Acyltransferase n=1 Tax=Sapientia aquatica TaxID=1549640 RepID=A0A4R5W277_9BURK|nr:acyltransferase [Sapientia aquatica]